MKLGIKMFEKFLKSKKSREELNPSLIPNYMGKGTECLQNDEFEDAIRFFDMVLKIDPNHINALNGKGSALMSLKRFDEAWDMFDASLKIETNPMGLINKGIICRERGNYSEALSYYNQAEEEYPSLKDMVGALKEEIAKRTNGSGSNRFSSEAQMLMDKGNEFRSSNRLWDALDCYETAIQKDPNCEPTANKHIFEIKEILMNEFMYEPTMMEPDFGEKEIDKYKLDSLRFLITDNKPQMALVAINQALNIDGNDLDALNQKGIILFYLDENDEAIKCFDKCLSIDEDYAYALFNKGLVMRRTGDLGEALAIFDELLKTPAAYDKVKPHQREVLDRIEEFGG
jgi:tetratricopeptide (TPR) repeat protein